MRIGIFVLMAGRNAGGPETYEIGLIRALSRLDAQNEYIVYCTGPEAVDAIGPIGDNFRFRVLSPSVRWISVSVSLPRWIQRDRLDVLHATFAPPPISGVRFILTAHCLSSFTHPHFYPAPIRWRLNALLSIGLRRASLVACVSETTMREVNCRFGVPAERMAVTYNGVSARFSAISAETCRARVAARLGITDPYVLYVGKVEARKNLARLISAFSSYRSSSGSRLRLVLAGRENGGPTIQPLIDASSARDGITRTGYVPAEDLPALYSGARMFVFPSLWEGFGIPIVEAMASGIPVLTSTAGCLPEIAGDAALLVNPESADAIAEGISRLDTSAQLRRLLIDRGLARASQFTWENCARSTLAMYQRAGNEAEALALQRQPRCSDA